MAEAHHTARERRATATPTVAAPRTPLDKVRPTIAPTAPARHTMKVQERLTRTPTEVRLRVNTEKGLLTRTPMAARRRLNTEKARRIRMFTVVPLLGLTGKVRTTPARMATALRIIRQPLIMAIIRPPR